MRRAIQSLNLPPAEPRANYVATNEFAATLVLLSKEFLRGDSSYHWRQSKTYAARGKSIFALGPHVNKTLVYRLTQITVSNVTPKADAG